MATPESLERQPDLPELTPQQEQLVAERYLAMLAEANTGFVPRGIFMGMAALKPTCTVEVGFVKESPTDERRGRVLLTQRPESDELWGGMWHVPGSAIRPTDAITHEHDYDDAIGRVVAEVGGGIQLIGSFEHYDTVRRKGPRGAELTPRFWTEAGGEPVKGAFFDMDAVLRNPPEGGLIDTHPEAIARLVEVYYDAKG